MTLGYLNKTWNVFKSYITHMHGECLFYSLLFVSLIVCCNVMMTAHNKTALDSILDVECLTILYTKHKIHRLNIWSNLTSSYCVCVFLQICLHFLTSAKDEGNIPLIGESCKKLKWIAFQKTKWKWFLFISLVWTWIQCFNKIFNSNAQTFLSWL